jgi:hypothetical protein
VNWGWFVDSRFPLGIEIGRRFQCRTIGGIFQGVCPVETRSHPASQRATQREHLETISSNGVELFLRVDQNSMPIRKFLRNGRSTFLDKTDREFCANAEIELIFIWSAVSHGP